MWVVLAGLCVNRARTGDVNQTRYEENAAKFAYLRDSDPAGFETKMIYEGTYIEPGTAAICAVFLGVGCAFYVSVAYARDFYHLPPKTKVLAISQAWLKIHTQPAPYTMPLVFGAILMDVSLTIMHLFPYSYLESGKLFMIPMAIQIGLASFSATLIFPESVGTSFTGKLDGVLSPIQGAFADLEGLMKDVKASRRERIARDQEREQREAEPTLFGFEIDDETDDSTAKKRENLERWSMTGSQIREKLVNSGKGLGALKSQEKYLNFEPAFSLYCGKDLRQLFVQVQSLQLRSVPVSLFFDVLATAIQHSHLDSQAFSVMTPISSRAPSLLTGTLYDSRDKRSNAKLDHIVSPLANANRIPTTPQIPSHMLGTPSGTNTPVQSPDDRDEFDFNDDSTSHHRSRKRSRGPFDRERRYSPSRPLSFDNRVASHASLMDHLRKSQAPVGMFESMKYLEIEKAQGGDVGHVTQEFELLSEAVGPLLDQLNKSIKVSMTWMSMANKDRSFYKALLYFVKRSAIKGKTQEQRNNHTASYKALRAALDQFRDHDRMKIIEPYRHLLDPSHPPSDEFDYKKLKHRALFWGFLFSYHMMEFTQTVVDLLDKQEQLDNKRARAKFWWPNIPVITQFFRGHHKSSSEQRFKQATELDNDIDTGE